MPPDVVAVVSDELTPVSKLSQRRGHRCDSDVTSLSTTVTSLVDGIREESASIYYVVRVRVNYRILNRCGRGMSQCSGRTAQDVRDAWTEWTD